MARTIKHISPAQLTTTTETEKLEYERLKYEHKETLDLGKYFYSTIYNIAPITFAANGILLAALQFLLKNKNDELSTALPGLDMLPLLKILPLLIGGFGIICNIGVGLSYVSCSLIVYKLNRHFDTLDRKLHFEIWKCRDKYANILGGLVFALAICFFLGWVLLWLYYLWRIIPISF